MRRKRAEQPVVFVLYFVLRALVLVTLVRSAFLGHYEHMMLCVSYPGAIAGAVADRAYA